MTYENFHEWTEAAEKQGCQLKQIQGFDQWEAYKDGQLVGHFASTSGTLPDAEGTPLPDAEGTP